MKKNLSNYDNYCFEDYLKLVVSQNKELNLQHKQIKKDSIKDLIYIYLTSCETGCEIQPMIEDLLFLNIHNLNNEYIIKLLNLSDDIHNNIDGKYYISKEKKDIGCLFRNIVHLLLYIEDIKLEEIIYKILETRNQPMLINEIYDEVYIIRNIKLDVIEQTISNDQRFICIDYKKWALVEWGYDKKYIFNYQNTLNRMVKGISERNWNVFTSYKFNSEIITLECIGNKYGMTRERSRQIIQKIENKFKHNSNKKKLESYSKYLIDILSNENVININELICESRYISVFDNNNISEVITILNISKPIFEIINNNYLCLKSYLTYLYDFLEYISQNRENSEIYNLNKVINKINIKSIDNYTLLLNLIKNDNRFLISNDKQNILISKSKITNSDIVYGILNYIGEPVHNSIIKNEFKKFTDKSISTKLVLSYLERKNYFVRVFTGTYGLKKWGCKEHISVTDLSYNIIKDRNYIMNYKEIYNLIKDDTYAKENSIQSLLECDERFIYVGNGNYGLSLWRNVKGYEIKYGFTDEQINNCKKNISLLSVSKNKYNYYISMYKITEYTLSHYFIRVSKLVDIEFEEKIKLFDCSNNYLCTLGFNNNSLFGFKNFINSKNICLEDVIVIEYISNDTIRAFTENQYIKNYIPFDNNLLNNTFNDVLYDDIGIEINDINSLINFGMKYGYIYYEQLDNINISEKYKNMTDFLIELNDMGIDILER